MKNPYKVLGVREDATQEEIRAAYLALVKKYHPDRYQETPLKELANEKLTEINQAYDALTRKPGSTAYDREEGARHTGYAGEYAVQFARAREWLMNGNLQAARMILDSIPLRNGEWHYLYGMVYYRQGWFDQARECFTRAHEADPHNSEYKTAYATITNTANPYHRGRGYGSHNTGCGGGVSGCDVCTSLICADCCCECMGGDLIRCC